MTMQYLSFQLAGEEFAFGILKVKEILEYDTITRVPNAPVAVRGVINLRGSVVPVVDLALQFSLAPTVITKRTCIVIVEAQVDGIDLVMGVLADAVSQVIDLGPEAIEPPPAFGSRVSVEYLVGMGKLDDRKFVLILDIDRLLGDVTLSTPAPTETTNPDLVTV
jgi:purine-binding chemotaxis protein CheW